VGVRGVEAEAKEQVKMSWHDEQEPAVYAPGERRRELEAAAPDTSITTPARIEALLTRSYHGDRETEALCHELARYANRFRHHASEADLLLRAAERLAKVSYDCWNAEWCRG
jgi:hypothetical protein